MIINLLDQSQMCNRLMQASTLLTVSAECSISVIHSPLAIYKQLLPNTVQNPLCLFPGNRFLNSFNFGQISVSTLIRGRFRNYFNKYSVRNLIPISQEFESFDIMQPELISKMKRSWVSLDYGWPTVSDELVAKHRLWLLDVLRFPQSLLDEVDAEFLALRNSYSELIGLHMRRGDYQYHHNGKYFWTVDQYKEIARRISSNGRVGIVLCSNEVIDPEEWSDLPVILLEPDMFKDVIRLSNCDYIIGPPSTYSMWAAFMADKTICHLESPYSDLTFSAPKLIKP